MKIHNEFRHGSAAGVVALLTGAIAIILLAVWLARPGPEVEKNRELQGQLLARATGLATPVKNRLADRFTDANGDGVADAPTDAAQLRNPPELTFSFVASADAATDAADFQPLLDHLSAAVGRPVKYLELTSPDAQLYALQQGRLHVTAFNTGAVPIAVHDAGFVPVGVLGNESGKSTYQLKIVVPAKSSIQSVEDLRRGDLVLTDPSSNSGFKAPLVLLKRNFDLTPGLDYAIRYSGGQFESIRMLAAGECDPTPTNPKGLAIAVASDLLDRAISDGTITPAKFRTVFTSEPFPAATFGIAHDLEPTLAKKLADALLSFDFANNSVGQRFAASKQSKLLPANFKEDFKLVTEIDNQIGYRHQIQPPPPPEAPLPEMPASEIPPAQPGDVSDRQ